MTIGATAKHANPSASNTITSVPAIATAAGDRIIIFGAATNDFAATPIEDSVGGNTYTPVNSTTTGSGRFSRAWSTVLTNGNANHTFSLKLGTSEFGIIFVVVISSADASPTVEGSGVRDDTGPPWDSNALSPAYACTLLGFNATSIGAGTDIVTWSNAFASGDKILEITDADNVITGAVAAVTKAAGTYTATSSSAVGTASHVWIVSVEEGAGGPTNIYVPGISQRNVRHSGRFM